MHEFPPQVWYGQGWWAMLWIVGLLVVTQCVMFRFTRLSRIPRFSDALVIASVAFVSTQLLSYPFQYMLNVESSRWQPFALLALLLIWGGALISLLMNWEMLARARGGWDILLSIVTLPLSLVTAVFIAYILPADTNGVRESARRTQCRQSLKAIGLAIHEYHDDHGALPASAAGDPPHSWRVTILPYLDQAEVFEKYDFDSVWNEGRNQSVAETTMSAYQCRSHPLRVRENRYPTTDYVAVVGDEMVWPSEGSVTLLDVTDGTSSTILVVEASGAQIPWCEPRDLQFSESGLGINLPGAKPNTSDGIFSSYHSYVTNVLLTDGSARGINREISPSVLKALLTRSAGDDVGANW